MFIQTLLTNPVLFLRIILIVIISISLHELSHGLVALTQGDDTPKRLGHLTINPVVHMGWESLIFLCIAGIAWGKMPVNPSRFRHPKVGGILVSLAGPLLNLTLAILFIVLLRLTLSFSTMMVVSPEFLLLGAYINLSLFMFNLLPIPPLDGFHVLSEFFPYLKPLEDSPFGLLALAILFTTGLSSVFSQLSGVIIHLIMPVLPDSLHLF